MDKIFLQDLKIDTVIGIYDWEREIRQTLSFDFEFDWDIAKAAASDNIEDTLDYGDVANTIVQFVEGSSFLLIESLAEALCELLLTRYAIPRVKLTLGKPVKLHGQNMAKIVIERSQ